MQQFSGAILGVDASFLFISFVAMVALFPFAVLIAFAFRMITVTQRTLTIGPFILRESADAGQIKELRSSE